MTDHAKQLEAFLFEGVSLTGVEIDAAIRQLLADYQQAVEALENVKLDGFYIVQNPDKITTAKQALAASDNWKPLMEKNRGN